MTSATQTANPRQQPANGLFFCRITPTTRLLRLPERCGTIRLRRLWAACFPLRA